MTEVATYKEVGWSVDRDTERYRYGLNLHVIVAFCA